MNDELRKIAEKAGCPDEVIDTLWFSVFIQKFTWFLMEELEQASNDI